MGAEERNYPSPLSCYDEVCVLYFISLNGK